MNKLLLFCVALITLSGCTTFLPVKQKFPEAPEILLADCEKLDTIAKDEVYFSEFLKTVVGNYNKYHICAAQNSAWKQWYIEQKGIFDKVNK